VRLAQAVYIWLALVLAGVVGSIALHRYRISLYDRNPDYPQFHPLQGIQYELFWVTLAIMVLGVAWIAWLKFRRR
jgi:hypothetical protein